MTSVSVVVPAYNEEKYIRKCIGSILNQILKDIDIILIDDGSTDKTFKIMEEYSKNNKNVTSIRLPHGGCGIARNKGVTLAKGEFIKFVDADDFLNPNSLELMYNAALETDADIVRCSCQTIVGPLKLGDFHNYEVSESNYVINVSENKDFIARETPSIINKLIKKELLKDIKFGEGIKWEDLASVPVLMAKSKKVYFMNDVLYNYRFNMSTTVLDNLKKNENINDIFKALDLLKIYMPKGYEGQYKSIFIIHTLYRVEEITHWMFCSKKEKNNLISKLLEVLDKKYPDWSNDKILQEFIAQRKIFAKTIQKYMKG